MIIKADIGPDPSKVKINVWQKFVNYKDKHMPPANPVPWYWRPFVKIGHGGDVNISSGSALGI